MYFFKINRNRLIHDFYQGDFVEDELVIQTDSETFYAAMHASYEHNVFLNDDKTITIEDKYSQSELINIAVKSKKSDLRSKFDEAIALITSGANPNEVQSWSIQEKESRNPDPPTPMIDALALSRGIDRLELIGRIIAKADAYAAYVGTQLGKLQKLEDQLAAATTISEVEEIQW